MEKVLLKDELDLQKAIDFFGKEHKAEITKLIDNYPCILIGNYADDIEFGENYTFTIVVMEDFNRMPGISYF